MLLAQKSILILIDRFHTVCTTMNMHIFTHPMHPHMLGSIHLTQFQEATKGGRGEQMEQLP